VTAARLAALVVLAVVAVGVALMLQRRRPDPPSAPSYRAPAQLDRNDFTPRAGAWAVVLFGSATCETCPIAWAVVQRVLEDRAGALVEAQRVDVQTDGELHRRYRIDGVPTTVVADPDGVVTHTFFGPMEPDSLADALTEAEIC